MQAYGWGDTQSGDVTGSDILQEVSVTVVTPELCQKTLDSFCQTYWSGKDCVVLTDGMLCAGSPGKDTCQVRSSYSEKAPYSRAISLLC